MMKRLLFVFILGTFFIGCKAKKRATNTTKNGQTASVPKKATPKKYKGDDNASYPLPKDTGKFIRFEISSIKEYINTFSGIAQLEMEAYNIPASITLAQGLLESGFGKGELAMKTNNHFGIKCHTGWEGDYDFHDDDEKGECFRKYNHPMYSYRDHSLFLSKRSRYAFLFDLRKSDYKRWAKGLRQAGYATDKRYPQKLINLIETYELNRFDREVLGKNYHAPVETVEVVSTDPTKTHVVSAGDTLYSISRKYLVSVDELKRLNNISNNIISIGQELTLKSKK